MSEGSIIGTGSVVTKDIRASVIGGGIPCGVIREINDNDIFDDMPELEGGGNVDPV